MDHIQKAIARHLRADTTKKVHPFRRLHAKVISGKKCNETQAATGLCQVHLNIFQLVICVKCHTLFFANVSHSKKHLYKDFALTSTCSLTHVNISCKNQAPFLPKHEFCHLHLKAALRRSDQLQNSYKTATNHTHVVVTVKYTIYTLTYKTDGL